MGQRNLVRAMKQDVDRLRSLISGVVIVWSEMSVPLGAFKGAGAEKKGQRAYARWRWRGPTGRGREYGTTESSGGNVGGTRATQNQRFHRHNQGIDRYNE
ncbi:hypothetical protein XENTR_v10015075 [Xenopus tropicalis]|nr:hypothetical protein XENTR_v10015075 [Xenopus tropicalis]